ncbi:hypothetical protein IMG5_021090 [Ichthyophthirius multifiliis]|uniref:Transmembrane protein n=1 Tax=Ichthyophthirius multifiliis TaxID=5932 RepID=G0QKS2_ICHMU|nr:hypothetical protein IMG5_021090 [Ichthyophthirius multifiliis]EGR34194.1 hypothetical protein IMG5_021090 [Ichthyophthirius multifiliis]|eukprot:XP_004039498.1 hypothetical protein IMG5_021090 [Ichthyophthirius multifiliis]
MFRVAFYISSKPKFSKTHICQKRIIQNQKRTIKYKLSTLLTQFNHIQIKYDIRFVIQINQFDINFIFLFFFCKNLSFPLLYILLKLKSYKHIFRILKLCTFEIPHIKINYLYFFIMQTSAFIFLKSSIFKYYISSCSILKLKKWVQNKSSFIRDFLLQIISYLMSCFDTSNDKTSVIFLFIFRKNFKIIFINESIISLFQILILLIIQNFRKNIVLVYIIIFIRSIIFNKEVQIHIIVKSLQQIFIKIFTFRVQSNL